MAAILPFWSVRASRLQFLQSWQIYWQVVSNSGHSQVGFDVLMVWSWTILSCELVEAYRRSQELTASIFRVKQKISARFLMVASSVYYFIMKTEAINSCECWYFLSYYTVSHPKWQQSSFLFLQRRIYECYIYSRCYSLMLQTQEKFLHIISTSWDDKQCI